MHAIAVLVVAMLLLGGPSGAEAPPLRCTPEVLGPEDTLIVEMRTPHGPYLDILAPDGVYFAVVDPNPRGGRVSLHDAAEFRSMRRLELPVAKATASPYVHGHTDPIQIFAVVGSYEIRLGENLRTHDGPPVYSCKVEYRGPSA